MSNTAYERALKHFQETGEIRDYGNVVYNWLDKQGKVTISKEKRLELMDIAKRTLIAEIRKRANSATEDSKIPHLVALRELEQNGSDNRVKAEAKRLALKIIFEEILKQKKLF